MHVISCATSPAQFGSKGTSERMPLECRFCLLLAATCTIARKLVQATCVKRACCSALETMEPHQDWRRCHKLRSRKISSRRIQSRGRFCPSTSANLVKILGRLGRPQGRRPSAMHGKSKSLAAMASVYTSFK